MFAASPYPTNPEFLATVDAEVRTQVLRLQHHPSIAIWCGNNELEGGIRLDKNNLTQHLKDYHSLFIDHVMKGVLEVDKTRRVVGSSSSNGKYDEEQEDWMSVDPGDSHYGDYHYYNYIDKSWDWTIYTAPRFASEYGLTSYSSIETYLQVLDKNDLTVPISNMIEWRQHSHGTFNTTSLTKLIGNYLDRIFHQVSAE